MYICNYNNGGNQMESIGVILATGVTLTIVAVLFTMALVGIPL